MHKTRARRIDSHVQFEVMDFEILGKIYAKTLVEIFAAFLSKCISQNLLHSTSTSPGDPGDISAISNHGME
jgi:hypothetical protein